MMEAYEIGTLINKSESSQCSQQDREERRWINKTQAAELLMIYEQRTSMRTVINLVTVNQAAFALITAGS